MYQRTDNKNTDVAIINIYCNYLQQNDELHVILNILQKTFQTSYDVWTNKYSNIRVLEYQKTVFISALVWNNYFL